MNTVPSPAGEAPVDDLPRLLSRAHAALRDVQTSSEEGQDPIALGLRAFGYVGVLSAAVILLAREVEQLKGATKGKADGGWLFTKQLFAPREVTRLAVPGASPDGLQRIEVGFADGGSVLVRGANIQAAWQALADVAVDFRALSDPMCGRAE